MTDLLKLISESVKAENTKALNGILLEANKGLKEENKQLRELLTSLGEDLQQDIDLIEKYQSIK